MPSPKRKIGDIGEGVTSKYLISKGYVILERNYWKPWGEIDIIVEKDRILIFVEVKSVSRKTPSLSKGESEYRPEENFHPTKLKRLHRAIQTYLMDHKIPEHRMWQIALA